MIYYVHLLWRWKQDVGGRRDSRNDAHKRTESCATRFVCAVYPPPSTLSVCRASWRPSRGRYEPSLKTDGADTPLYFISFKLSVLAAFGSCAFYKVGAENKGKGAV